MIPSGATTLSDDIGFLLVTEGVYPDAMDRIPTIDWSNGGRKNRWRLQGDFTLRKEDGAWKLTSSRASTY